MDAVGAESLKLTERKGATGPEWTFMEQEDSTGPELELLDVVTCLLIEGAI
ncbi:hypothetical protein HanRHA438_Chr01g0028931 [Helianthus annuus]|nr:hypothetical protein HanRHA438_Chr01g0028931 [Helianthus annuus]